MAENTDDSDRRTDDSTTTYADLRGRPRVRNAYEPEEIIEAYNVATSNERRQIRMIVRALDGGRFHTFLANAHEVLAHSDLTRQREFLDNYSEHLFRWIQAYAKIEDQNDFAAREADR